MKLIKFLFAFALMLFLNAGALTAQSLSDLSDYSWKDQSDAINVLDIGVRDRASNLTNPVSIYQVETSEFKIELYKGVRDRLQNNKGVSDAIWESYSEIVQSNLVPATSPEEQKKAFEQLIELLKK